jgi:uncharacterized protein
MKAYVLYHKNCADGMGAAWAAHEALGDEATYIACAYQEPLPEIEDGSAVYVVDFSFKKEVINQLAERCRVIVLDHHKTAQEDLVDAKPIIEGEYPAAATGLFAKFDMTRSGAVITWNYFFPNEKVPKLLQYIEDRDLWKWQLPYTKEVSAWVGSQEWSIDSFSRMSEEVHISLGTCVAVGEALLRSQQQTVEMISEFSKVYASKWGMVALVNATAHWSELGNHLCTKFPFADCSISYYFDEVTGKVKFSARSIGDFDVSSIAKEYGGGGHKNAAGFALPVDELGNFFQWVQK